MCNEAQGHLQKARKGLCASMVHAEVRIARSPSVEPPPGMEKHTNMVVFCHILDAL